MVEVRRPRPEPDGCETAAIDNISGTVWDLVDVWSVRFEKLSWVTLCALGTMPYT